MYKLYIDISARSNSVDLFCKSLECVHMVTNILYGKLKIFGFRGLCSKHDLF